MANKKGFSSTQSDAKIQTIRITNTCTTTVFITDIDYVRSEGPFRIICMDIHFYRNPRDLEGLYNRMAGKVIRIVRKNTKYTKKTLNNKNIESYDSLKKLNISAFNRKGIDKDE